MVESDKNRSEFGVEKAQQSIVALRLILTLKGQLHEIIDSRFFSSINPTQGPDSLAKTVSHMALYSPR
jgi:hypothetical protein